MQLLLWILILFLIKDVNYHVDWTYSLVELKLQASNSL
jgi:hypothetical protein